MLLLSSSYFWEELNYVCTDSLHIAFKEYILQCMFVQSGCLTQVLKQGMCQQHQVGLLRHFLSLIYCICNHAVITFCLTPLHYCIVCAFGFKCHIRTSNVFIKFLLCTFPPFCTELSHVSGCSPCTAHYVVNMVIILHM